MNGRYPLLSTNHRKNQKIDTKKTSVKFHVNASSCICTASQSVHQLSKNCTRCDMLLHDSPYKDQQDALGYKQFHTAYSHQAVQCHAWYWPTMELIFTYPRKFYIQYLA
jgi:hypothetical protein